ncbi:hypothetical protein NL676_000534 [Syzygium grande]|nr:hypothetical protein NL676_000534 [Syzygium grande]
MIESCLRKRTGSSTFCSPFAADNSLLPSNLESRFCQLESFRLSKTRTMLQGSSNRKTELTLNGETWPKPEDWQGKGHDSSTSIRGIRPRRMQFSHHQS